MKCYLLQPNDIIVELKILHTYNFESKVELTQDQIDLFYINQLPKGKRRKAGTLDLEDIPEVVYTTEQLQQQAKQTRDNAVNADIEMFGVMFQCSNDAKGIRNVIDDAATISAQDSDSVMFRLSDNTWRETTLAEIKQVLVAFIVRKRDIWNQHGVWDTGDKSDPFVIK